MLSLMIRGYNLYVGSGSTGPSEPAITTISKDLPACFMYDRSILFVSWLEMFHLPLRRQEGPTEGQAKGDDEYRVKNGEQGEHCSECCLSNEEITLQK